MKEITLVRALRETVSRLRTDAAYQWGHFGACNCGHLAQTLTRRSRHDIQRAAVDRATTWAAPAIDDWGDAAIEYCANSGLPLDAILEEMLEAGLTLSDIRNLEDLSDPRVLRRLPPSRRHLRRNDRRDLICYLETWAELLDDDGMRDVDRHDEPLAAE